MKQLVPAALALLLAPGPSAQDATARPWTFMIYAAADNNADGPVLEFVDSVRKAVDDDPGLELILFIDRSAEYSRDAQLLGEDFTGARVYRMSRESAERVDATEFFPELGEVEELDSADPRNLGRFVSLCKARFPAERYGLMIYSHADGRAMCPDDESGREMSIPGVSDWVDAEASVDFLALELCNMGGIEIAYQWRPGNGGFSTDVLVAIPNTGIPLDWDRAFARIRTPGHATDAKGDVLAPAELTAARFGALVVEEGYAGRRALLETMRGEDPVGIEAAIASRHDHLKEAAASYDLTKVADAKRAIDRLAVALVEDAGSFDVLDELRGAGDDRIVHYARQGKFQTRPYVDAFDLFDLAAGHDSLSEPVREAAARARDAVDELILDSFGVEVGWPEFQPDVHGIFIVFPTREAWAVMNWYSPLAPEKSGDANSGWAFLADGATPGNGQVENWFELLDAWYDDDSLDPAGRNGYAW